MKTSENVRGKKFVVWSLVMTLSFFQAAPVSFAANAPAAPVNQTNAPVSEKPVTETADPGSPSDDRTATTTDFQMNTGGIATTEASSSDVSTGDVSTQNEEASEVIQDEEIQAQIDQLIKEAEALEAQAAIKLEEAAKLSEQAASARAKAEELMKKAQAEVAIAQEQAQKGQDLLTSADKEMANITAREKKVREQLTAYQRMKPTSAVLAAIAKLKKELQSLAAQKASVSKKKAQAMEFMKSAQKHYQAAAAAQAAAQKAFQSASALSKKAASAYDQAQAMLAGAAEKIAEAEALKQKLIPPAVALFVKDLQAKMGGGFVASAACGNGGCQITVKDSKVYVKAPTSGLHEMSFAISVDGVVDPSTVQASYYGASGDIKVEGQLLFEAMTAEFLSEMEALVAMTQAAVVAIDHEAIFYQNGDDYYKAYRDPSGKTVIKYLYPIGIPALVDDSFLNQIIELQSEAVLLLEQAQAYPNGSAETVWEALSLLEQGLEIMWEFEDGEAFYSEMRTVISDLLVLVTANVADKEEIEHAAHAFMGVLEQYEEDLDEVRSLMQENMSLIQLAQQLLSVAHTPEQEAIADLAARLGLTQEQASAIQVTMVQEESYSNGCTNRGRPDSGCTQAFVTGTGIFLSLYQNGFHYFNGQLDLATEVALIAVKDRIQQGTALENIVIQSSVLGNHDGSDTVVLSDGTTSWQYTIDASTGNISRMESVALIPSEVQAFVEQLEQALGSDSRYELGFYRDDPYHISIGFKSSVPPSPDGAILASIFFPSAGRLAGLDFKLTGDGKVDLSTLQATYQGADNDTVFSVDAQLLFEAMGVCPEGQVCVAQALSDADKLAKMTQITVTLVDQDGTIYFTQDKKNYKTYRDANGTVKVEEVLSIPLAVQRHVDQLNQSLVGTGYAVVDVALQEDGTYRVSLASVLKQALQGRLGNLSFVLNDQGNFISVSQTTYVDVAGADGQLLYEGMARLILESGIHHKFLPDNEYALFLMTQISVSRVENSTIFFTNEGKNYKTYRDASGAVKVEEIILTPPAVQAFVDQLKIMVKTGFTVTTVLRNGKYYGVALDNATPPYKSIGGIRAIYFTLSDQGVLEPSGLGLAYYKDAYSIASLDNGQTQLLFGAVKMKFVYPGTSDAAALGLMSQTTISKIENGAIFFTKSGKNYKTYRDTSGNIKVEEVASSLLAVV